MDHRIDRIRTRLAALPGTEAATLGPVLSESEVAAFERSHNFRLPEPFRLFVTHIGHGGYGPTYGLLPLDRWTSGPATPGETITVVYGGCSDWTLLVVDGPDRGRLREVNDEGFFAPFLHSDGDFLSWYERWLDFVLIGHRNLHRFREQMAGDENTLLSTLATDTDPARRQAAASTFITFPAPSRSVPDALARALATESRSRVREEILRALSAQGSRGRARLPAALADPSPKVRSLAAILMTTSVPGGRHLVARLRQALATHLPAETDDAVRETISRQLGHSCAAGH